MLIVAEHFESVIGVDTHASDRGRACVLRWPRIRPAGTRRTGSSLLGEARADSWSC